MAIFFDSSKITDTDNKKLESVLEFNMEINDGVDILTLTFESLPTGKHSPYRVKIPIKDKGKSTRYETIFFT